MPTPRIWVASTAMSTTFQMSGWRYGSRGLLLPYRVFSKDQRVSHTAIVENKRLGHTLALIKAQQDSHFEVKIKTNSEKGEYQKRGQQIYGPDYVPKIPTKPAAVAEPTARKA